MSWPAAIAIAIWSFNLGLNIGAGDKLWSVIGAIGLALTIGYALVPDLRTLNASEREALGWRDRPYSTHRHPEAP